MPLDAPDGTVVVPVDEPPRRIEPTPLADANAPPALPPAGKGEFVVRGVRFQFENPDFMPLPPRLPLPPLIRPVPPLIQAVPIAPGAVAPMMILPPAGSDPRPALRAALAERDAAAATLVDARAALDRGEALVADAESALRAADAAQQTHIADLSDRLRVWVTNGDGEQPVAGVPVADRVVVETNVAAARQARDALVADLASAESEAANAQARIEGAVIAILQVDAADLADRTAALEAAAADLRGRLGSLGSVWLAERSFPLPRPVVELLRDPPLNARGFPAPAGAALRRRWTGYAARLRENPEARFED